MVHHMSLDYDKARIIEGRPRSHHTAVTGDAGATVASEVLEAWFLVQAASPAVRPPIVTIYLRDVPPL